MRACQEQNRLFPDQTQVRLPLLCVCFLCVCVQLPSLVPQQATTSYMALKERLLIPAITACCPHALHSKMVLSIKHAENCLQQHDEAY